MVFYNFSLYKQTKKDVQGCSLSPELKVMALIDQFKDVCSISHPHLTEISV